LAPPPPAQDPARDAWPGALRAASVEDVMRALDEEAAARAATGQPPAPHQWSALEVE
jgi:hypothetical protein